MRTVTETEQGELTEALLQATDLASRMASPDASDLALSEGVAELGAILARVKT